jgi:hypothetical protein
MSIFHFCLFVLISYSFVLSFPIFCSNFYILCFISILKVVSFMYICELRWLKKKKKHIYLTSLPIYAYEFHYNGKKYTKNITFVFFIFCLFFVVLFFIFSFLYTFRFKLHL